MVLMEMDIPERQIRASYDEECIVVYQAYSAQIARAALSNQRLSASPEFKRGRMTWIKPSWCWMMYRCGYSYKDKNQERVLALYMKHENFLTLLENACITTNITSDTKPDQVRVQWDPERDPWLQRLKHRSIQVGIPSGVSKRWTDEWIERIEDVTEKAQSLKHAVDNGAQMSDLRSEKLLPEERIYRIPDQVAQTLGMTLN